MAVKRERRTFLVASYNKAVVKALCAKNSSRITKLFWLY